MSKASTPITTTTTQTTWTATTTATKKPHFECANSYVVFETIYYENDDGGATEAPATVSRHQPNFSGINRQQSNLIRVVPTVTALTTNPTAVAQKSSILVLTQASLNELLNSSDLNILNVNNNNNDTNNNNSGAGSNEWKSCDRHQENDDHDENAIGEADEENNGENDGEEDEDGEEEEEEEEERPSNAIIHLANNRDTHIYPNRNYVTHANCHNHDEFIGVAQSGATAAATTSTIAATTTAIAYNILQPSHNNQHHTSINNNNNSNN